MNRWAFVYPFLFALAPILQLGAYNVDQVEPEQILAASGCALIGTLAVFCGFWFATKNRNRAALCAAAVVVFFFSYGYFYVFLYYVWLWRQKTVLAPCILHGLSILILGGAVFWVCCFAWRTQKKLLVSGLMLTVTGFVFVTMSTVTLLQGSKLFGYNERFVSWLVYPKDLARPEPLAQETEDTPDVYYIILDGYARADILSKLYDFDNSSFIDGLRRRGFWVGEKSLSNYPTTFLSLSSSLNMRYNQEDVDRLRKEMGDSTLERRPFYAQIQDSYVSRKFQSLGYRYVTVLTSWAGTESSRAADMAFNYSPILGREFYNVLLTSSALRSLAPSVANMHRFTLEKIAEIPDIEGPTFAFVHVLMPHNPYVFDREGRETTDIPSSMQFLMKTGGWKQKGAYIEQMEYLNGRVLTLVDKILSRSAVRPVIVLQADHGSATTAYKKGEMSIPEPWERLAILNAMLVPEAMRTRLYDAISPVNTFRLLFDSCFDGHFELLPDRSYFSWYQKPYDLKDATEQCVIHNLSKQLDRKWQPTGDNRPIGFLGIYVDRQKSSICFWQPPLLQGGHSRK